MALATTTSTLTRQYNAFTGLSAVQRSQSGIARAELVYYTQNATWAAPGAGNNRIITSGFVDLPVDFGYVVTEARALIRTTVQTSVLAEAVGHLEIWPGGILGPVIDMQVTSAPGRQDSSGTTQIGSMRADYYNGMAPSSTGLESSMVFSAKDLTSSLLYPFNAKQYTSASNPATQFRITLSEDYLNGPEYDVNFYLRFIQYDIDQSYNYVIQSPQLTR